MSCFSCTSPQGKDVRQIEDSNGVRSRSRHFPCSSGSGRGRAYLESSERGRENGSSNGKGKNIGSQNCNSAYSFTFHELATATKNFKAANLIGEGGFGRVYKGRLERGHARYLTDLDPDKDSLDWNTRMKIAVGAAQGLEYLHCKANPLIIYHDLKSANILLDSDFNPKLSDFGLAKLGPVGEKTHVSTRVMGTYGYRAPEYAMSGKLTLKSDVYSFGVLLLEPITGRKAIDCTKSRPFFKDQKKFVQLVDPLLKGCFPVCCLHHAIAITAMCLQERLMLHPVISDIVVELEYLASQPYNVEVHTGRTHSLPPSLLSR